MQGKVIRFAGTGEFDPDKVFDCGQCFRFTREGDGWHGVAGAWPAHIWREGEDLLLDTPGPEAFWRDYLDLDRDYRAIREGLAALDGHLGRAAEFGRGIRILRQDPWETLVTFIFSQCNNIPRIRGLVERLAAGFGEPVEGAGRVYYAFPGADRLARCTEEDLAPVRAGFRTKYVLAAARAVDSGALDLDGLCRCTGREAVEALKALPGVGEKVAGCVALFGLHHLDAFPVDVWMRRTISENYGDGLDPAVFGAYSGIAQQYLFYYARWAEGRPA